MPGGETFRGSADAYERLMGRYGPTLAPELIGFAGLGRGMRAVDVGCGTGALTSALAALLGPENVAGAEPSPSFAEACRRKLPEVEVVEAPAEGLPFDDDRFDAALSQLVINFMADAEAGVQEMARVTRAGGIVAACVWDYAGEMTLLRTFWDSALEVEPERAAASDEGVQRWCSQDELSGLWGGAGLRDVRTDAIHARASYESFDDLWTPLLAGVGPSGAFVASLDDDGRSALRDTLRRRLGAGDAAFELTARAWAVAGTVP